MANYLYDTENHWIGELIDSNGDGTIDHETGFAYDGNQIVLQFDKDVSERATGSASALDMADLSHRYLWLANAVDQLMADEQLQGLSQFSSDENGTVPLGSSGTVVWTLGDQQGTIRDLAVTDASTCVTSIVTHRVYDSYGNLISVTDTGITCLFGYTGRAYDTYSGLQNNWHRWYDSIVGRWASEDWIGYNAGYTNILCYCGNSPTNATDPSGLWVWPWDQDASWNPIDTAGLWFGEGHPIQVGTEWLTGQGPRTRNFTEGDIFTEMLRQHEHLQKARQQMIDKLEAYAQNGNSTPFTERIDYDLGGLDGILKYIRDYSTLLTGGTTGNLAVTYLGSYKLTITASSIDLTNRTAILTFVVENVSSIQSATRPPVIGYTTFWKEGPGASINKAFQSGPLSPTKQRFEWTEKVSF